MLCNISLCLYAFLTHLFFCLTVVCESKKCHSFYNGTKHFLGTKTPYSYIAGNFDGPLVLDGCTPVRLWALVRHGTRNPGKIAEKMRVNLALLKLVLINHHESGRGNLCSEDVDKLRKWNPTVDPSEHKFLTHEGEEEMLLLGERFQNRFPELLPEIYSNKTYKFRYTATQRTRESAHYFTVGLFGRQQSQYVWYPEPLTRDPILRFYKLCKRWKENVDNNLDALEEVEQFKTKNSVTQMLDSISERIGLNNRIKYDDAKLIYQTCAFETAWHPKIPSPWCSLFSKEDLEIIEFSEDLKYYWIDGYGYPITYQQACVAISDVFQHLTDVSLPPATFYFSHSGTMLKMLCHLGLHRDSQPLSAHLLNRTRLWRTSHIDVFGSNLAFILFRCGKEHKVLTLHQERPVTLPGCPPDELCPLDLFENLYKESIHHCNFDQLCSLD